jgi:hypothetical protein
MLNKFIINFNNRINRRIGIVVICWRVSGIAFRCPVPLLTGEVNDDGEPIMRVIPEGYQGEHRESSEKAQVPQ